MNAAVSLSHNVCIKSTNRYGTCNQTKVHNKANFNLVSGILKFLQGYFNVSNLQTSSLVLDTVDAKNYIPTHIGFGFVALKTQQGIPQPEYQDNITDEKTYLALKGSYYDSDLFTPLNKPNTNTPLRYALSSSTINNSSLFDSESLILSLYLPKGQLCADLGGAQSVSFTEIGLFSGGDSGAKLLARVLVPYNEIVTQNKDDIITINWNISITSISE